LGLKKREEKMIEKGLLEPSMIITESKQDLKDKIEKLKDEL
jgi:hypothetical protein